MTQVTEQELISRSTAPRVTEESLLNNIKACYYLNPLKALEAQNKAGDQEQVPIMPELGVLTICILVLNNGFTVTGESACADPANYREDIGNRIAFEDAKKKIWAFMGYNLKEEIYLNGDGTFKGRLEREERELKAKLEKLKAFYTTDTFKQLPLSDRELLVAQMDSMEQYHGILLERLA